MSHSSHVWSIVNNVWQCGSLYSSRLAIDTLLLFWSTHKRQLPRFSEVQVLVLQSGRAGRGRLPPFWTGKNQHICLESDFFGWSLKLGTRGNRWEPMGTHGKPQDADLLDTGCSCHPGSCRQRRRWQGRCWTPWVQVVQRKRQRRRHINEAQKKWPDQKRWKKPLETSLGNIWGIQPLERSLVQYGWNQQRPKKISRSSPTTQWSQGKIWKTAMNHQTFAKCWGHPPSTSSLASSVHKLGPSQGQQMAKVAPLNLWIWYIIPYYTIIPYNNV